MSDNKDFLGLAMSEITDDIAVKAKLLLENEKLQAENSAMLHELANTKQENEGLKVVNTQATSRILELEAEVEKESKENTERATRLIKQGLEYHDLHKANEQLQSALNRCEEQVTTEVNTIKKLVEKNEQLQKEIKKLQDESVYKGIACMSEKGKSETHYLRTIDKLQAQLKEAVDLLKEIMPYRSVDSIWHNRTEQFLSANADIGTPLSSVKLNTDDHSNGQEGE